MANLAPALDSTRRGFLIAGTALAGELVIGFALPGGGALAQQTASASDAPFQPGHFIRIDRTGAITVTVPYAEMGQGALTAVAMLVAEELEVDPRTIRLEHAPGNDAIYGHPLLGDQITGGSLGVRGAWKQMRQAGAAARIMLTEAAARSWSVDPASCRAEAGAISHPPSGRRAPYGTLIEAARSLPIPQDPPLRMQELRVIGKELTRLDAPAKVDGSALFGIDRRLPGMRYAAVMACPIAGGSLAGVDHAPALAIRGVRKVVELPNAVAVVADHTGAARKGLAALAPRWNGGPLAALDTAALVAQCDAALERTGVTAETKGDPAGAMSKAQASFAADYRMPMLAHAAMEPLNCTVHVRTGACEVWVGSQVPGRARKEVAAALGLPVEAVTVNNHLIGGGFGRRLQSEWIVQAAMIARQLQEPLQVIWSREEDMRQGSYRFHNHSRVRVGLDAQGLPVSWQHRIVGPAVMAWFLPPYFKDGVDLDVTGGAYGPYTFPNLLVDYVRNDPPAGLLAGNWRGVGDTRNCFVVESVIDELANRAKRDPVDYRRALLAPGSRIAAVLERLVTESGWTKPLPPAHGRGVSLLNGFGSYIGLVAEAEVVDGTRIRIPRITCVIDCGRAVNPGIVRQQIEGGIVFGLSAAFFGRITLRQGQVEQSNFHDYPVLRMNEMPQIDVIIMDSVEEPGGVGEPGTAVLAPAITNAIFAATGRRLRSLPIDLAVAERA